MNKKTDAQYNNWTSVFFIYEQIYFSKISFPKNSGQWKQG